MFGLLLHCVLSSLNEWTPISEDATLWRRQLIIICLIASTLFLCRYRILRFALSYLLSCWLRRKWGSGDISVSIDVVSFRSLRCDCVHIRIGSEGSISIERVRFRILIKEFFLFLGTNKLLFIEIDGINGQLSLAILQRFQQLKSKYAKGGPDTEERSSPREPHQTGRSNMSLMHLTKGCFTTSSRHYFDTECIRTGTPR